MNVRVRYVLVLSAALIASLSACDGEPKGIGDITLVRSGGLAGHVYLVTVAADGTITRSGPSGPRPVARLDPVRLKRLHELVNSEDFKRLRVSYLPAGYCCDRYEYKVSAQVGANQLVVTTGDNQVQSPGVLKEIIGLLNQLFA